MSKFKSLFTIFIFAILVCIPNMAQETNEFPPRGQQGEISIKTDPAKALAFLGGEKLGYTPIDTTFASGRHTLTIMLDGEEILTERVNVWPGKKTSLERNLTMPYGTVKLTTKPGRCKVYIDGEEVGVSNAKAPLVIHNVEAGNRLFQIEKGGKSKDVQVEVLGEEEIEVEISLQ